MSETLMQFGFEGHNVRVHIDDSGIPWWVASDVCDVIGIVNHRDAVSHLESDEYGDVAFTDAIGRSQKMKCVNESGLYRLIFRSNKPEAKRFQKWVFSEVIPQIRKTGSFQVYPAIAQRPTREAVSIVEDYLDLARLCKAPDHIALIEASKATKAIGVDISGFLQASSTMDDVSKAEIMLEPTEMASLLGFKSGKEMNKALERLGLQSRIGGRWVATDKADGMYYQHAWQNHGKSGYNLKWNISKVEEHLNGMLEESE